jgi:putative flippase GtrA
MRLFSLYSLRERHTFARFSVIGALGFLADACVLQLVITMTNVGPLFGRIASFAFAVMITFALNWYWTFSGPGPRRSWAQAFPAYLTVQSVGLAANMAVYTLIILLLPHPLSQPVVALAFASAFALGLNYVGAREFVFRTAGTRCFIWTRKAPISRQRRARLRIASSPNRPAAASFSAPPPSTF